MRVTHNSMTENALRYLAENQERIAGLQEKIGSTKQYQRVSDNPAAVSQALSLRSSLQASQSYLETAQNVDTWMDATDSALGKMFSLVTRAITLVTKGLNDTMSPADRASTLGIELAGIVQEGVDAGNTRHLGNYIFSGFLVTTPAFELAVDGSTVTANSDAGVMTRDLGPGQTVPANINGQQQAFTDFYAALIKARDALSDPAATDMTALSDSLGDLNTALTGLTDLRTSNGGRQRQVQAVIGGMDKATTELKSLLSQREDTNMAEAISLLENQTTTYQAVLEVTQRAISSLNLFDVLQ